MNRLTSATSVVALVALITLAACSQAPASAPPAAPTPAMSAATINAVVFRSPTCACCHEHEAYLRGAGINTHAVVDPDVARVKQAYGVPTEMYSCHTTDVGGYFVEGHVPLEAILALIAGQPDLDGIALPGMPAGSPGMGGEQEGPLTVFGIRDGQVVEVFGTY